MARGSHKACRVENFSVVMGEMFSLIVDNTKRGMEGAVREACKVGARSARQYASIATGEGDGLPLHRQGRDLTADKRYTQGFTYRLKKVANQTSGTVYHKTLPGLVHLLEKGHARVGGGRVQSYPHLTYAADDAFNELELQVSEAIEEALLS